MKVELQCGDTIAIPEDCKAIVKDGIVTIEKDFEDGDVLHSVHDDLMLIYKESCSLECFSSHFNMMHNYNNGWNTLSFRHATEEEKQLLFDKMKEQGLRWNAEEKRVEEKRVEEKIRWRAEKGKDYYFVYPDLTVINANELGFDLATNRYKAFNYFRTEEQAKEAAKLVKETLRKYHEEIGE